LRPTCGIIVVEVRDMRAIGFAPAPAPPPAPPPNISFADFVKAAEIMTIAYNAEKNAKAAAKSS
jgi:hypothetical protein